jgi:LEA14-like dessication related protein
MNISPKLRNGLIIGGLAVAGIALIAYFKKQIDLLKNACYTISGGVIHSLGLDKVKMTLFFKIVNESDITIQISDMDFNIYVNNMFVTKIVKNEPQTVYSQSDAIIKLDVEFNPADLLRAGLSSIEPILYDKEKLIITTKGNLSIKSGIFKLKKFPFSVDITLKEMLEPRKDADRCEKLLKKK